MSATTSSDRNPQRRGPGRPRMVEVDEKILRIALEVLSSGGYSAMSMDAVAEGAGVSKPTIYRRWGTKIELATAAIATMAIDSPPTLEPDVWDALVIELRLFNDALHRDHGINVMGTILALEEQEPLLINDYREKVSHGRRARFHAVFNRGIESGQLPPDVDVNVMLNMMLGFYYSSYIGGDEQPDDWPERCVSLMRRATTTSDMQSASANPD